MPVQLWQSERGGDGVAPHSVAAVNNSLSAPHEYHVAPNSAHSAFLSPCPPAAAKAHPDLCTDAPGFDRVAFHSEFDADVLAFLRKHFAGIDKPQDVGDQSIDLHVRRADARSEEMLCSNQTRCW